MKSPLLQHHVRQRRSAAGSIEVTAFADPWDALDDGREKRDNWLLSYIDILTLFLTLFVVLLALQPKEEAPPVDADPGNYRFVAPELIERQTAPAALTVAAEPQPNSETSDTRSDLPAIPESSEISDDNESGAELLPPFSIFASLAESATPLIYPADAPAVAEPQLDAAVPVNVLPAAEAETTAPGQPVASVQPTPAVTERSEIERFMAKLAQQQLNDQVRVAEVAEGVYLEVNDNILFALGSAELKNEGAALLDDLAQLLLEQSGIISVEGHTDDRPIATSRFPSNWELSSGRATTVTRYLIGKGLDRERMRAVGYADTRPLASNSTTEGRARNRRVALIVEIPRR